MTRMIFAGYGGQGLLSLGEIVATIADCYDLYQVDTSFESSSYVMTA